MAIVILCGLMSSTLLNMFVVPTLYLKYGRMQAAEATRRTIAGDDAGTLALPGCPRRDRAVET